MKRFLLLGAMAIGLSGCVSDGPGGRGYDPYWDGYEARPVVVYQDRYRPRPIYRDSYEPYRGPSPDYRRDGRRYDDRTPSYRRSEPRRPDYRDDGPSRRGPPPSIRRERPERSTERQSVQRRPDAGPPRSPGIRPGAGPRPYMPPVRAD